MIYKSKNKNKNKRIFLIINKDIKPSISIFLQYAESYVCTFFYHIDITVIQFDFAFHYLNVTVHFCDVIFLAFFDVRILL